jgi:hypothetical protein
MYLTKPCWCAEVSTVWPILNSDMVKCYFPVDDSEGVMVAVGRSIGCERSAGRRERDASSCCRWEMEGELLVTTAEEEVGIAEKALSRRSAAMKQK